MFSFEVDVPDGKWSPDVPDVARLSGGVTTRIYGGYLRIVEVSGNNLNLIQPYLFQSQVVSLQNSH